VPQIGRPNAADRRRVAQIRSIVVKDAMSKDPESSYRRFTPEVFRAVAARELASASPARTTKRLLVVEEDPRTREALEIGLADAYEVITVPDAEAALAMLDAVQFDLMLVDLFLPGLILHEMRASRLTLPAVFVCETAALARIVKEAGAASVMKPIRLAAVEKQLAFVMAPGFDRERPTEPSIEL
jgi:CheY-like chemotaxis protein